jgi:hypothetical protein
MAEDEDEDEEEGEGEDDQRILLTEAPIRHVINLLCFACFASLRDNILD